MSRRTIIWIIVSVVMTILMFRWEFYVSACMWTFILGLYASDIVEWFVSRKVKRKLMDKFEQEYGDQFVLVDLKLVDTIEVEVDAVKKD